MSQFSSSSQPHPQSVDFFEDAEENEKDVGDDLFILLQYCNIWNVLACLELAYQDLSTSSGEPGALQVNLFCLPVLRSPWWFCP